MRYETNYKTRESTVALGQSLQSDRYNCVNDYTYQSYRNTRVVTSRISDTEYSTYNFEKQGYCSSNTNGINSDNTYSSEHHGQSAGSYFRKG